ALFFLLTGAGISAVLNVSDEQLEQQSLETLQDSEGRDNHHAVGENIIEGSFTDVINNDGSLRDIVKNNEVTVINFFASWCDPCMTDTTAMNEYQINHENENIDIVGINIDDSEQNRDEFLEEFSVTYPVYEFENESEAIERYSIHLMPTTFFVDNEG